MKGIITYKREGINCISQFSFGWLNTHEKIYKKFHENIDLNTTNISLGYCLSRMPKFTSRLSDLKIRSGKFWEDKLLLSMIN